MSEHTDPRVGEIQARLDAAVKEPWHLAGGDEWISPIGICIAPDDGGVTTAEGEFIAAAPADVAYLLAELRKLQAKLDGPCGSCHPCTEWANQTWINAGERLPHVIEWQNLKAELRDRDEKLARVEGVDAPGLSCTIHTDCVKGEVRAEFAGSSTTTTDVAYLLTELQSLAAELSRDAENAQHYAEHGYGNADGVREAIYGAEIANRIRAAVAAAGGGGES